MANLRRILKSLEQSRGLNKYFTIMKKLELKNLDVQEMNTAEMSKVNGGGILNALLFNTVATVGVTVNILTTNVLSFLGSTLTKLVGVILS